MKAVMVGFEAFAVWAILQLLAARGLPATRILLYAWHPLPLWEFAGSGHADAIAIACLLLGFVAVDRRSPTLGRPPPWPHSSRLPKPRRSVSARRRAAGSRL